jgi:tripartite-type tricarboxylate transporter receptor subunit TctC
LCRSLPRELPTSLHGWWLRGCLNGWASNSCREPIGRGSNVGIEAAVKATADGYTLVVLSPGNTINATLYERLNFNIVRDIAPVAGLSRTTHAMLVHPSLPVNSVSQLIAYAKANPGKINMASSGVGTGGHMAGELLKMMAGVNLVHVPYRGEGPALSDLVGG